ncbi:MAG: LacI family transcriptional regulator [Lachnospiraceae bacterium]|nr:LacI family transcriptional regulator [Lachnospiraceae bacterium]
MSLKEIAKKAGVSVSTVSRVLNNPDYHCAKEGIRDKVWQAAVELNYSPNVAARNLKLGLNEQAERTFYINVIMTRMDEASSDPFFTEVLHSVESQIHNNMCILSKIWYISAFSDDKKCRSMNIKETVDKLYMEADGKSDGLVIIGKCNVEVLKALHKKYKNVVSVNRNSTNYEVDEVLCDGSKIAKMATEYLVKLGHTRIGYVGECHNEARYKGFLSVLQKYELDIDPDYIIETKQTEAEGYEAMKVFSTMSDGPSAIYSANDITAIGMLKYRKSKKNNYYKPAIIASDDIEQAQYTDPMLSTVRLPKDEMGKFAITLLIDRMRGGHESTTRIELEGKLVIRDSCEKDY